MTLRLLIASCPRWGYVVPPLHALQDLRDLDWSGATLLHRDRAGVERAAAGWWRFRGGTTELVEDGVAAVERVQMVLAFIPDRDPEVMAVLDRAAEVGVPAWVHSQGRYPYPVGSLQYQGIHPAQLAARAAERRASDRNRAAAVAEMRAAARARRAA